MAKMEGKDGGQRWMAKMEGKDGRKRWKAKMERKGENGKEECGKNMNCALPRSLERGKSIIS
ncbi:MAG: hypothetical protein AAB212_05945 [Bacteroidota bacterium]